MSPGSIDQIFQPQSIWVYTDGSGSTVGMKAGSYAATIMMPDNTFHTVAGAIWPTTNNRMELLAINAAILFIKDLFAGAVGSITIHIVCDSQITANIIAGSNEARSNLDLWAQFRTLIVGFASVFANQISRNSEAPQRQSDAICHVLRVCFEKACREIVETDGFKTLSFERDSIKLENEDR
jgi:ribonuclease HI